jgi:hypothetical protein
MEDADDVLADLAGMLTLLASSLSQRDGMAAMRLASRDGGGTYAIGGGPLPAIPAIY